MNQILLDMHCQKWKLFKKKNIMSSDSKLEPSVNSVRMFWRARHFRTCSREEKSIITMTAVHGIHPYRDDYLAPPCLLLVQNTKTEVQNMQCLHFNSASSRYSRIKRYRGGGRKGAG